MRYSTLVFSSGLALLSSLMPSRGVAQQAEPTLEDLESLGENVEANAALKARQNPALAPAGQPARSDMIPANDGSMSDAIDIRSHMKKISEPNLFAGAAPNPGTLRNLATGEAPEEYQVHEGDTLFDICDQLIDEPNYWPKLWAFNPNIANPHFVYPGMRLRFYAGDNESPPFLQVVTEDDVLPVAKGNVVESELVREDISGMLMRSEIPENMKILDPNDLAGISSSDGMFFTVGGNFDLVAKDVLIPAFIVDEEFEEMGRIVGGSAGSFLADKGEQIVMKNGEGLKVGTTYSVVRKGRVVKNESKGTVGTRYEFIAQVKVNSQDKDDGEIYKGSVVFNRLGIQPGDLVVPYRSARRKVPYKAQAEGKGLEQTIVDFSDPDTVLGGRGDFVFIDQTEGKLKEKETYTIIQNIKKASSIFLRSSLPDTDNKVAEVYIVDISGSAALGYILHNGLEVRAGDRIAR